MKGTAWTLLLALPMLAAWELSLLHVNDIHARMEETNKHSSPCTPKDRDAGKCFGGLARIVTAVKRVQNEDQVRQGGFVGNNLRGAMQLFGSTVETSSRERCGTQSSNGEWSLRYFVLSTYQCSLVFQMNAMLNFDAMTLGNHEFDDGSEGLEPFLRNRTVPMVVSNMDTT